MRLMLKAGLGMMTTGAVGTALLVGAYLALFRTPAPIAQAQTLSDQFEAARPKPPADTTPPISPPPISPPSSSLIPGSAPPPTVFSFPSVTTESFPASPTGYSPPQQIIRSSAVPRHEEIPYRDPQTGEVRRISIVRSPAAHLTPADLQALQLAEKIRRSEDDAERAELRKQLVSALESAFEERRKRQSEAIADLEKQLDELRALYAQRGERKDEIVQRRVNELLAEPDVLAWDPAPRVGNPSIVVRRVDELPSGTPSAPQRSLSAPTAPSAPRGGPFSRPQSPSAPAFNPPGLAIARPEPSPADAAARQEQTASPDRAEASSLGDAAQILELLAEISQLEAELDRGLEGGQQAVAKQRLQLARAKLELAEIRWAHTKNVLQNQVDAAKTRLEPAETRLAQLKVVPGTVPTFELLDAEAKVKQAAAELQAAENLLRAWERTDAILRNHRGASEPITEEPRDEAEAGQFPQDAPAPEQQPQAEPGEPSATLAP